MTKEDRERIRALESKIVESTIPDDLIVGDKYIIVFGDSVLDGINYGIWQFQSVTESQLNFIDVKGAYLSIPCIEDSTVTGDRWMVIPEG